MVTERDVKILSVRHGLSASNLEDRREILSQQLRGNPDLSRRTKNVLARNSVFTIGDLALMTEGELREVDGVGEKMILDIYKVLNDCGFTLLSEGMDGLAEAIRLYGRFDDLPLYYQQRYQPFVRPLLPFTP